MNGQMYREISLFRILTTIHWEVVSSTWMTTPDHIERKELTHLTNESFASSVYSTEDGRLPIEVVLVGGVVTNKVSRDIVVPHFDNHPLGSRQLYMDDNARPHRARTVNQYKQQEAIYTITWPAMSPDMNPRACVGLHWSKT
jgi:hypothetical protein